LAVSRLISCDWAARVGVELIVILTLRFQRHQWSGFLTHKR
jgi:hypothetical protein